MWGLPRILCYRKVRGQAIRYIPQPKAFGIGDVTAIPSPRYEDRYRANDDGPDDRI